MNHPPSKKTPRPPTSRIRLDSGHLKRGPRIRPSQSGPPEGKQNQ
ncbi:MAG: hypothetical protein N2C14_22755 [Planctomycetales bacterium]